MWTANERRWQEKWLELYLEAATGVVGWRVSITHLLYLKEDMVEFSANVSCAGFNMPIVYFSVNMLALPEQILKQVKHVTG